MDQGDFNTAQRYLAEALQIDCAVGSLHSQALDLGWLGKLHWLSKEYATAIHYLDRALSLDRETGGGEELDWHLIWRMAVACESGDLSGAWRYLQQAEQLMTQGYANLKAHDILQWKATLYLPEGNIKTAQQLAQKALTAAQANAAQPSTQGEILTLLGRSFGADPSANEEEAHSYFEEALKLLPDTIPTMYLHAMSLQHYGSYLAENGHLDQARTYLHEAQQIFDRIGITMTAVK